MERTEEAGEEAGEEAVEEAGEEAGEEVGEEAGEEAVKEAGNKEIQDGNKALMQEEMKPEIFQPTGSLPFELQELRKEKKEIDEI